MNKQKIMIWVMGSIMLLFTTFGILAGITITIQNIPKTPLFEPHYETDFFQVGFEFYENISDLTYGHQFWIKENETLDISVDIYFRDFHMYASDYPDWPERCENKNISLTIGNENISTTSSLPNLVREYHIDKEGDYYLLFQIHDFSYVPMSIVFSFYSEKVI